MAVTLQTLRTSAWDAVYNRLQTGAGAISTSNIYSSYNDNLIKTKGYPIVEIMTPNCDTLVMYMDGSLTQSNVNFIIRVYHNKAESLKTVVDAIVWSMVSGKSVFYALGLIQRVTDFMPESQYDAWQLEKKTVHVATLNFNYIYRETINV